MISSYLIYFGLLIFCFAAAYIGEHKNRKEYAWIIVAMFTLIAGLRHGSVGIDTLNYLEKFEFIANGEFEYAYALEITFKIFCFIVLKLVPSKTFLLTLLAIITNWCIIQRFWELRRIASFPIMVVCYYMSFYFMTMNVMRQFCAIGLLFYSTRFLIRKKPMYYIAGMIVAAMFHQSALLGCALLLFEIPRLKELEVKHQKIILRGVMVCAPVLMIWAVLRMVRYWKYFNFENVSIGIVVPTKIVFFIASLYFVFRMHGKKWNYSKWEEVKTEEKNSILLTCGCYALGLCFLFGSYILPILNRMGWYFTMHECVYMGIITKINHEDYRYILVLCVCGLVGIGFITAMTHNSQGTMPYLFFWQ